MARKSKAPWPGASVNASKVPRAALVQEAAKSPATLPQASSSRSRPSWRFSLADQGGRWPLSAHPNMHELMDRLGQFETMTCAELEGSGILKHYPVEQIPTKDVLARLEALHFDDQTRLSRFRCGGAPRLYGFLDEDSTFHALWWDPKHEVWPSVLKHT